MQQDSYSSQDSSSEPLEPPQLPFPESEPVPAHDMLQIPFPEQPPIDNMSPILTTTTTAQIPFLQQLPSTETVDTTNIAFQAPLSMPIPGMVEVPFATQAIPVVLPTQSQEGSEPPIQAPSNQEAKRAIINGVISFLVSVFALITVAGFAGLVIGTFAIIYGLKGLQIAKHLPNKTGRGQAFIGIILGLLAWSIVLIAIILRAPQSS